MGPPAPPPGIIPSCIPWNQPFNHSNSKSAAGKRYQHWAPPTRDPDSGWVTWGGRLTSLIHWAAYERETMTPRLLEAPCELVVNAWLCSGPQQASIHGNFCFKDSLKLFYSILSCLKCIHERNVLVLLHLKSHSILSLQLSCSLNICHSFCRITGMLKA